MVYFLIDWTPLDGNRITTFSGGEFRGLKDLKFLGLGSNLIAGWDDPIFAENHGPRNLNLKDNKISAPTPAMVRDFREVVSLSLKDNPLACDCGNTEFLRWMREESNFPRMKLDCSSPPEWLGKSVWEFYSGREAAVCRTQGPDATNELSNRANRGFKGGKDSKLKGGFGKNSSNALTSSMELVTALVFGLLLKATSAFARF